MEEDRSRRAIVLHARWNQKVWKNESHTPRVAAALRQEADARRRPENILGQKQNWKREQAAFTFQHERCTEYDNQRVEKTCVFWHLILATSCQVPHQTCLPKAVSSKVHA
jgi:hypothetical protein